MGTYHTIKQGEHLSRLAEQYGFSDYKTIWNDAGNADLKRKRQNPNVLLPGDILFVPERELRTEERPTDKRHNFVLSRSKLKLRLIVEDRFGEPVANAPCLLSISSDSKHLTTDGDGQLEQDIPAGAEQGMLVIRDSDTNFDSIEVPVNIGHLDPIEEFSGQWGRLANLGYLLGPPAGDNREDFESAVEEFQCENGLKVDGVCGPKTQAKLKQVHGC